MKTIEKIMLLACFASFGCLSLPGTAQAARSDAPSWGDNEWLHQELLAQPNLGEFLHSSERFLLEQGYVLDRTMLQHGETGAQDVRPFIAWVWFRGKQTFRLRITGRMHEHSDLTENVLAMDNVMAVGYPLENHADGDHRRGDDLQKP